MATEAVEVKDPDVVEIPADMIQLGFDDDGMPKSEPTAKAAEVKEEPKAPTLAELKAMEKERDAERERAAKAEREAAERAAALEAERAKNVDTEKKLVKTQDQALGAHYHKTRSDYAARHSDYQQIVNAISSTEAMAASHEAELKTALEAGNHAKAATAQRAISRAEAHLAQLEAGKSGAAQAVEEAKYLFEEADKVVRAAPVKEEPKKEEAKPVVQEQKPDPDQWIAQWPKKTTGEWLKTHKDYVTDAAKHKELMEFVSDYYNEGNPLHTKDFVKALNEKFDPSAAETEEVTVMAEEKPVVVQQAQQQKPAARTISAAPVSQGGNFFSSANMNAKQVKLPPKLAAFVKSSGLDPVQYALGAVEDIKAGKLPKNFLDPDYPHDF